MVVAGEVREEEWTGVGTGLLNEVAEVDLKVYDEGNNHTTSNGAYFAACSTRAPSPPPVPSSYAPATIASSSSSRKPTPSPPRSTASSPTPRHLLLLHSFNDRHMLKVHHHLPKLLCPSVLSAE
ncbi:hypothetical protein E2562_039357 [Oryza meyeriana var. granulata]|uniref:Uncharacterized protein n=1 Tax=Oryza meyeriana var. granulata TaxID=110450 RepID=A0A6G1E979_9ORYZ|nr:hypothetical protein E2562_039357 [Oryza meyeriana var. granulata]